MIEREGRKEIEREGKKEIDRRGRRKRERGRETEGYREGKERDRERT